MQDLNPLQHPGEFPWVLLRVLHRTRKAICGLEPRACIVMMAIISLAYKNDPLNLQSLGSNIIESICADKDGIIWVGTKGYGLDRFDPATGIFTHFRHNPQDPQSIQSYT